MKGKSNTLHTLKAWVFILTTVSGFSFLAAWNGSSMPFPKHYSYLKTDTGSAGLKYPDEDSRSSVGKKNNRMTLKDPSNIERKVEYDPETHQYVIKQTVGNQFYRDPMYMSFDEYQKYQNNKANHDYWKQKSEASSLVSGKNSIPKLYVPSQVFDRIFGGSSVDIRPQGSAELIFSGKYQTNENPLLTARARNYGAFDFQQKIQLNVVGNIGDKLKVNTNYNTEATFDFENQFKLEYTGYEDEIIKKIELGNVSLPLTSTLISGSQSLFGIKTQLQFGRLTVTSILTQQKSDQKEIAISNGAQKNDFKFSADNYEANKHYFLSQYFRDNYDNALSSLPAVKSAIQITKVEVWVTNKTNVITDTRDIVAFMDLGENNPYNTAEVTGGPGYNPYPSSGKDPSNDLLRKLPASIRNTNDNTLDNYFQKGGADNYAKLVNARRLSDKEFTFNPQLGYISLNSALNSDEILGVSYRYNVNGKEYTVGEFSTDINPSNPPTVLFVKLLKNVSIKTYLPTWKLMMKNIYSLNAFQVNKTDFKLDILYLDEKSNSLINYFSQGDKVKLKPIISLLRLDKLNSQGEAKSDGVFDFIDGVTISSTTGKIIFPLKEPFAEGIDSAFGPGDKATAARYSFHELYDSTKYRAQQYPQKNKFTIRGSYQSSSSSEFNLNAINVPQGSVKVTSGTTVLTEGADYTVDYNLGRVKILNEGILNSGNPIKIKLESATLFGIQSKSLFGSRFDYKINDKLNVGGTLLTLSQKPITQKVTIGDESVRNTMYGADINYRTESRFLTSMVDKIPLINTKEISTVTVSGEYAYMDPGHASALNAPGTSSGLTYIDDFEGTKSVIDLRNDKSWFPASTPQRFIEAKTHNIENGFHRALLSTYVIEPLFYATNGNSSTPTHIKNDKNQLSSPYVRQVAEKDVFPFRQIPGGLPNTLNTLNLTYYPGEKGQYNFNTDEIDANGNLIYPQKSWGGIMRGLESSDFESLNVEYIEFWMLDPFINNPNAKGGDLYFDLGNISEDVLKDGRKSIENGLPIDHDLSKTDTTVWGRVARTQPVTNSFDSDPASRQVQDVGFDGLSDNEEADFFRTRYLDQIATKFGTSSEAYRKASADPSGDNYRYFLGTGLDANKVGVIERYKYYNNVQSNSPTTDQSQQTTGLSLPSAATPNPTVEDVNRDNTMNTLDEYFEYKVSLNPNTLREMDPANYITDKVVATPNLPNNKKGNETWYQFKIPIKNFIAKYGNIQDFKSMRFIRMYLTNFSDTTFIRFARLQLVRSEWRKVDVGLAPNEHFSQAEDDSQFDLGTINYEDNGTREPIPYRLPPSVSQERNLSDIRGTTLLNEQSLSMNVCNLGDGHQKAAYKNVTLDVRSYKRLEMFAHAEGTNLKDGDVTMFIRFGTDFTDNYYEYEIPMHVTQPGTADANLIWPGNNKLDIPFTRLQDAKQLRNSQHAPLTRQFSVKDGDNTITVVGSPDLSSIKTIIIGVRNPSRSASKPNDDGLDKCATIWVDELRLKEFDESGGWAATGRVNAKLADFANVTLSGSKTGFGFGSIDSKVSERSKNDITQGDISSNIELGKFVPDKIGLKVPMYVAYSRIESRPQYTPGNPDLLLSKVLDQLNDKEKDSLQKLAVDLTTRRSINFTNVKKVKTGPKATKPHIYDVENLSASYAYTEERRSNYTTENRLSKNYKGTLNYNFTMQPKNVRPLERVISSDGLKLLRDFNFYYMPSALDFRFDVDRTYTETQLRNVDFPQNEALKPSPTFDKSFNMARVYGLKYDLTRGLKLDFSATNLSRVSEPYGRIDNEQKRDTIRRNFYSGGKTTDYSQIVNLNYQIPINKLPLLDFVSLSAKYGAKYDWKAPPPSLQASGLNFGNTISNSQTIQINPQLNMSTLYNKSKFLKSLSAPKKANKKNDLDNPLNKLRKINMDKKNPLDSLKNKKDKEDEDQESVAAIIFKGFAKALIGVKNIGGTYTETNSTLLPGYLNESQYFGSTISKGSPGVGFILGSQNDIRSEFARKGWITKDTNLNNKYLTGHKVDLNLRSTIEPMQDLRIELTATRSQSLNTQSFFKADRDGQFTKDMGLLETGTFSISYVSVSTAFETINSKTNRSPVFQTFEDNRAIISRRLGDKDNIQNTDSTGIYRDGYGRNSQQVLIPAFLAAYSGKSADKINMDPFPAIPIPNWRISYTGLSKIPFLMEIFTNISINHAYRSTYNVNNFTRPLALQGGGHPRYSTIDSAGSRNFIPEYEISQITLSEQFAPLIGIDATLKSNITINLEYRKSRNLSLSFANNRLEQLNTAEFVIGTGYRTSNLKLPFTIAGVGTLKNDVNFKFDFSIRDNRGVIHILDGSSEATSGSLSYAIKPSIDYVVNSKLTARIFYDRTVNKPYTTNSFNTSFTNFGISIRFTLS